MVEYIKYTLANGLRVVLHQDTSSPLVAINVLYNVGSKHESPGQTGLTHLFEHLMFSGTKNIPNFDDIIQKAGGENNAFTNNDFTNYYDVLPKENLEVGLWLEADRMANMVIKQKPLTTQKKVVIEEFKEVCLNEPYGDMWHHLGEILYPNHPYNWPVIGKQLDHIESVKLSDAVQFYDKFYNPNNAVLSICGDINYDEIRQLVDLYFGHIVNTNSEPIHVMSQGLSSLKAQGKKKVEANVPADSIILAFKMCHRLDDSYYVCDLLTDILSEGRSSRLYQKLVKDQELFSSIDAYITGTTDEGALVIEGKLMNNVTEELGRQSILDLLAALKNELIDPVELQKIKNKAESNLIFSESSVVGKAMSLGYYEYLGNIDLINDEIEHYNNVTNMDIKQIANELLVEENMVELYYNKC